MNLLFLAHRIPYPPDKGCKIRAHHWIAHLAKQHHVWCAFFVDDPSDLPHIKPLSEMCAGVLPVRLNRNAGLIRGALSLATGRSVTEGFLQSTEMTRGLNRLCIKTEFDAALAYSSGMVPYLLNDVQSPRKVADYCDLDGMKWLAYADRAAWPMAELYKREGSRVLALERMWVHQLDEVVVIARQEANDLKCDDPTRIHVIPNGCTPPEVHTPASKAKPIVTFFGMMDYKPNVDAVTWFAREVWPMVFNARPDAVFQIAGRRPTKQVQSLHKLPGVRVAGEVKNRVDLLSRTAVSVAPLRIARGIQNKVLEAMAAKRPVVLTSMAANGIDAVPGQHYDIADDGMAMADRVLDYLNNHRLRDQLGQRAARFVSQHFNWNHEANRLEQILLGSPAGREVDPPLSEELLSRESNQCT
jgi:sugar transferase (PEP-CTERM/EpsH1 system associated)